MYSYNWYRYLHLYRQYLCTIHIRPLSNVGLVLVVVMLYGGIVHWQIGTTQHPQKCHENIQTYLTSHKYSLLELISSIL